VSNRRFLLAQIACNKFWCSYEQDWLWTQFMGMQATTRTVRAADDFLSQMDAAAAVWNVSIQYCMALPRHALSASAFTSVTHIRVRSSFPILILLIVDSLCSDDYGPGSRDQQWRIGRSSLLPSALNIAPYKDSWWSSARQPGAPYNGSEPHPFLQSAVSALSTGPITPGDGLGYEDASVIERTCTRDGRLLQPTVPAIQWDQMYLDEVFGNGSGLITSSSDCCNSSEIWISHTITQGNSAPSYHVLAADMPAPMSMPLLAADWSALASACSMWAVWRSWPFDSKVTIFSVASAAFSLAPAPLPSFELHHAAPFGISGWAVLGEKDKWVPVAAARLVSVQHELGGLLAVVRMVEKEVVTLMFASVNNSSSSAGGIVEVKCDWQHLTSSLALVRLPAASCSPM
jgi:hypothetical protein